MIAPGLVAVATPIIVGLLLGSEAVAGMLMVGTISGVLLATVLNNGGGAWDNAKKYIESGSLKDDDGNVLGKGSSPRRGRRRRHRRRSVQGHRRPVAPRPGEAAGDDHPRARPAVHPLGTIGAGGRSPAPGDHRWTPSSRPGHGDRAGAHRVPAGLVVRPPDPGARTCSGWDDPFINSLAFSVMLHTGRWSRCWSTSGADWLRLVPAGLGRHARSLVPGDPDRRLAWLLVAATIPAAIVGLLFNDFFETVFREPGIVAVMLVVGGVILWLADRSGRRTAGVEDVTFPIALGIGVAQALALFPGISRSGISISAGRLAGLDREAAARFAFLMATPITAGAGRLRGRASCSAATPASRSSSRRCSSGMVAALVSGLLAIGFLLRYLRSRSLDVFVLYRFVLRGRRVIVCLR